MGTITYIRSYRKPFITGCLLLLFSFSFSQTSADCTTTYSLDFVNGISSPTGDFKNFSESGFNSGFTINRNFCSNISIGLNTNYTFLPIKNINDTSNEEWNSFSINIGPQYNLAINKVFVQFYGRIGLSFIDTPEITGFYAQTDFVVSNIEKSKTSGFNTRLGINLGTNICNGLRFFIASEYSTHLNNDINYQTRDLSSAVILNNQIDPEIANEIPLENSDFSFSSLNVNIGITLDLNPLCASRATDHNSSRSNKTSHTPAKSDGDGDGDDNNGDTKATDHNSSRSNKTSHTPAKGDGDGDGDGDDNNGDTEATDHNSSRSNKTSHTPAKGDGDV